MRETAELEVQQLRVRSEKEAASAAAELAERRAQMLSELGQRQRTAEAGIRERLAEASALQSSAAEHLAEQTTEAARIRSAALAETDQLRQRCLAEADALVQRAQQDAMTIEERARQELAWRKRQVRKEQDLVNRRKQAVREHLVSLSALATETAANLPDVPEAELNTARL